MISLAVSQSAVSTVTGFLLDKGYFGSNSTYLPQSIVILGQANTNKQSGLSTNPVQITSAKQAATTYGDGSPIHSVARILFPSSGAGVSIPVYVYPQAAAGGAVAKVITVTPTGTATDNGTVKMIINGRTSLDGGSYDINIESGDTPTLVCNKMRTAIAAAFGCPVSGSGTATFIATARFKGLESNDINITIDTGTTSTGVTFAVVNTTAGSGTASVAASLTSFGNQWHTLVVNTYGLVSATITELEAFNGVPDPTIPTGRYAPTVFKPILALSGTVADDPTAITSASSTKVTIVACPAPLSNGLPYEAAANMAYLLASCFQDTPHGDIIGKAYPDMPAPTAGSIPQMNDYTFRQYAVTHGCSTVDFVSGQYIVKDVVTTYNLDGEFPPFYRWARDLNIYMNIKFGYHVLEVAKLVGKTLTKNSSTVTVGNVVKPKTWKSEVLDYIKTLESLALITDSDFSKNGLTVEISGSNPNRLDTEFPVKITGIARVAATTVKGGFNFGN